MNLRLMTTTALIAASAAVSVAPAPTRADDRFLFPEQLPGPPAYLAEVPQNETYFTDGEWACIPVYREIAGIPWDFNLLNFLDNATPERRIYAQSVPLHVHGFVVRSSPPPSPPELQYIEDMPGMPFVRWSDLQQEIADGELYIDELLDMDLRIGIAEMYMEEVRALPIASHRRVAFGELLDGTPFYATYNHGASLLVPEVEVRIAFGE